MNNINFNAMKKFKAIPKNIQQQILNNIYCSKCGITTIVEYTFTCIEECVVIKGKCKKCNREITRLIGDT